MSTPTATHTWTIDSIEEHVASIELDGGKMLPLPQSLLPHGAKEGDVLLVTIEIDTTATRQAVADSAAQVQKGSDASRKRDPGGNIQL